VFRTFIMLRVRIRLVKERKKLILLHREYKKI